MKNLFFMAGLVCVMASSVRGADPSPNSATLIGSDKVAAAFAKGTTLVENKDFKVMCGHREAPGIVEIHAKDTDIFHIIEGTATFITGGTPVDVKDSGPGEQRVKEIKGGAAHQLHKDDVIIIPQGVPHWFKEVNGTFLYYVVKITDQK